MAPRELYIHTFTILINVEVRGYEVPVGGEQRRGHFNFSSQVAGDSRLLTNYRANNLKCGFSPSLTFTCVTLQHRISRLTENI